MKKLHTCEVCGEGQLHPAVDHYVAEYKGATQRVMRHHHKCDFCQGDYALASDARENKREIIRFHKSIDAIPLGCEIRAMRLAGGLSQIDAGNLFGGGPTAFSKYETDDLIPSEAMINLIKLAIADLDIVWRLQAQKGVHLRVLTTGKLEGEVGTQFWLSSGVQPAGEEIGGATLSFGNGSYGLTEGGWTQ